MDDQILKNSGEKSIEQLIKKHNSEYAEEAERIWGGTKAYRESKEKVSRMGKDGLKKALSQSSEITQKIASCMKTGLSPEDEKVQKLVEEYYKWLGNFYEPNKEIFKGLAKMYLDDPRFTKTYEDIAPGLAKYMSKAMIVFCSK
ncbi:MAG: TipAS antibiotic-recognition domain-containing protein [Minisyncoccia bacterium]